MRKRAPVPVPPYTLYASIPSSVVSDPVPHGLVLVCGGAGAACGPRRARTGRATATRRTSYTRAGGGLRKQTAHTGHTAHLVHSIRTTLHIATCYTHNHLDRSMRDGGLGVTQERRHLSPMGAHAGTCRHWRLTAAAAHREEHRAALRDHWPCAQTVLTAMHDTLSQDQTMLCQSCCPGCLQSSPQTHNALAHAKHTTHARLSLVFPPLHARKRRGPVSC